jgi:hypothetical protein
MIGGPLEHLYSVALLIESLFQGFYSLLQGKILFFLFVYFGGQTLLKLL